MEDIRFLAVRIHNMTRSCVLMRRFENGVWTLPLMAIGVNEDPMDHLGKMLAQIRGEFELIHAVSIFENTEVIRGDMKRHINIVYDIRYKGKIYPHLPLDDSRYVEGKWMPIDVLINQSRLNIATSAFAKAMEKESCLR